MIKIFLILCETLFYIFMFLLSKHFFINNNLKKKLIKIPHSYQQLKKNQNTLKNNDL